MTKLVNRAKMTTATTGTGTITLGSAVDGYQTFAAAGVADADVVRYVIEDGDAWEIGLGTYTASGTTLTRGSIESSNADNAINLTGNAVVYVSAASADLQELVDFADNFVLPTADGSTGQVLTTNGAGTLSFTTISGYTDADVDTHLNTGTAASGEVLSWNGSDYDWVAVSGGATDIDGLSDGYSDGFSVGLGVEALGSDDGTSNYNTALGYYASKNVTTGTNNIGIGWEGLRGNSTSKLTGSNNIGLGYQTGFDLSTGAHNFLAGNRAGTNLTTGSGNVAIGRDALYFSATTVTDNVSIGTYAGLGSTSIYGVNIGGSAGYWSQGAYNIGIGHQAMRGDPTSKLTGARNVGIGDSVGIDLTTGAYNFLGGYQAGTNLTTGSDNVMLGREAGLNTTVHSNIVAIGDQAARTTGDDDIIAIGDTAAYTGSGYGGIGIGRRALYSATGGLNTALGTNAGDSITTGTNNMCLGANADASSATVSNEITLGNSSIATLRCQVTTITSLSDARDKTDIQPLNAGLDFVNALEPVSFTWNMRDGGKVGEADTGFVAQDLQAAQADTGVSIPGLVYDVNPDKLEAGYGKLIPVLVQAIKDLSAEVKTLKAQLEAK